MSEPNKLTVENVVAMSVENPASYFHGAAITAIMRYRGGQGVEPIRTARAYLDHLEQLEERLSMASGPAEKPHSGK